jgi:hypothetical protein
MGDGELDLVLPRRYQDFVGFLRATAKRFLDVDAPDLGLDRGYRDIAVLIDMTHPNGDDFRPQVIQELSIIAKTFDSPQGLHGPGQA